MAIKKSTLGAQVFQKPLTSNLQITKGATS